MHQAWPVAWVRMRQAQARTLRPYSLSASLSLSRSASSESTSRFPRADCLRSSRACSAMSSRWCSSKVRRPLLTSFLVRSSKAKVPPDFFCTRCANDLPAIGCVEVDSIPVLVSAYGCAPYVSRNSYCVNGAARVAAQDGLDHFPDTHCPPSLGSQRMLYCLTSECHGI